MGKIVKGLSMTPIEEVLKTIGGAFMDRPLQSEDIGILNAAGRMLSDKIISRVTIPEFAKSTVDGYAIRFCSHTSVKKLIGKVGMGSVTDLTVDEADCVYVPTGAMIPSGAQTMVMVEDTVANEDGTVTIIGEHTKRNHIIEAGEDIKPGETVLHRHTLIGTHEIGALASLGFTEVNVLKKPTIMILSTGDELVSLEEAQIKGKVRDINTYMLKVEAEALGFEVLETKVLKDDYDLIRREVEQAVSKADVVCVSGGSSVGEKDMTATILSSIGDPGVLVHGMAIKPGKPTIVASIGGKPIFGLPGHPVSAIVVFRLLIKALLVTWGYKVASERKVQAVLVDEVVAAQGRDTYQMVSLTEENARLLANPTNGKSGLITYLTQSNGYVVIPKEIGRIEKGTVVDAYYF
ncbi:MULTISPECIES: molybdopterin molybdotransferase MoeA [unclassified Fusibacter]|uniref:molybdopterin molybdotransferase MoeA n=1 Tax=unclassified Fusibacter TaxID=2624464 RepID=UPI00101234EC|nr:MULTISPECIES: molybdopterin molybdotransferase MoeA [unclassified Fusibacter]MCK8058541.1 molybdopterin molybdotransferase MoeA [Fusibacter sp. A2]NPE22690.1 molybdopterin molybdotransferase MoeA [Fusibacter sp. A1]RXV60250.1 molybdopterin molybdenumtransferase MoeA [Fusibacter sp. A1]